MSLKSPAYSSGGGGGGGVTSITAGTGITASGSTGAVTLSATAAVLAGSLSSSATSIAASSGGITLPSGYGTILITGTATGSATTCPCTMPATPTDQQMLFVMFNGTQVPTFAANTGQNFPSGAPNSQACNVGSFYLFFYDGSNKLGQGADSWYVVEYLGADDNPYSATASYTAGSFGAAIQALQNDVSTIVGTTAQITVAFTAGSPGTFTLSLPTQVVIPGTWTAGSALGTLIANGFADGSNATAGTVGEYVDSGVYPTGSGLTTNTPINAPLTSFGLSGTGPAFVLTAGDWEVDGSVLFVGTGTTITYMEAGLNSSSATLPGTNYTSIQTAGSAGSPGHSLTLQPRRFSSSGSQNVYIGTQCNFTAGSIVVSGFIRARRIR